MHSTQYNTRLLHNTLLYVFTYQMVLYSLDHFAVVVAVVVVLLVAAVDYLQQSILMVYTGSTIIHNLSLEIIIYTFDCIMIRRIVLHSQTTILVQGIITCSISTYLCQTHGCLYYTVCWNSGLALQERLGFTCFKMYGCMLLVNFWYAEEKWVTERTDMLYPFVSLRN